MPEKGKISISAYTAKKSQKSSTWLWQSHHFTFTHVKMDWKWNTRVSHSCMFSGIFIKARKLQVSQTLVTFWNKFICRFMFCSFWNYCVKNSTFSNFIFYNSLGILYNARIVSYSFVSRIQCFSNGISVEAHNGPHIYEKMMLLVLTDRNICTRRCRPTFPIYCKCIHKTETTGRL